MHRYILPAEEEEHWAFTSMPCFYTPSTPHFTPADRDVDQLEAMLPALVARHAERWAYYGEYSPDVSAYVLLYSGETTQGRPKIWLRAIHRDALKAFGFPATPAHPAITLEDLRGIGIADGGCVKWAVMYDFFTGTIDQFSCNGA